MAGPLRFVAVLVTALALLVWAALAVVTRTTRGWFERDLAARAQLAVSGSQRALAATLAEHDDIELYALLADITRDERIMASGACAPDGRLLAHTAEFPLSWECARLVEPALGLQADGLAVPPVSAHVETLPGGPVHVSALPLLAGGRPLGVVVLVQDLAFVARREGLVRQFMLVAFLVLAVCASVVTLVAARLSWRGWSNELRRLLRGGKERPELQPLLHDVRELVEQLTVEKEIEGPPGWNAQRLKQTLSRHLHGERVVIVANREPYIHERRGEGIRALHPASGLVTALEPVMRACGGTWIAHGSGSADRETADEHGRIRVPPGEESYVIRRVWLSQEEERGYYYGFANEGLWPLCHVAHTRPTFRIDDWRQYEAVNRKFADAVAAEVDSDDPIVLIQDYHFALAPRLIRERLPRATLLTFWHIPWMNAERFGVCPWRAQLLDGLLGSSIIGFHTQQHCNNFLDTVDRYLEARIDREQHGVVHQHRSTLVRPYPISIEWPSSWANTAPSVAACREAVHKELELDPRVQLGIGVDRLDYTKGVEERFLAVERLLERFPAYVGRFTFVQLAAPSRTVIPRYQELNQAVDALAARINARFRAPGWRPIALLRAHHEPPDVFRYYRAADVCYVSSLHDGMNLVAKEFVAARDDEAGVLVLSAFTGAARELTEALVVNPYDLEEASGALATALTMSQSEQADRLRAMRAYLSEFNVYRWAGRMLIDGARVRSRERLSVRLSDRLLGVDGAA